MAEIGDAVVCSLLADVGAVDHTLRTEDVITMKTEKGQKEDFLVLWFMKTQGAKWHVSAVSLSLITYSLFSGGAVSNAAHPGPPEGNSP